MSMSPAEKQSVNYKSSKEDDCETTCPNCISYGVFENNKLKVPCLNCANDNNFMWQGKICYGSLGDGEIDTEEFANNIYFLRYQHRHQVFREDAEENKTTCIDEMIKGDIMFCASGVTNGDLVKGVKDIGDSYEVSTFALHKDSKTIKKITNTHNK